MREEERDVLEEDQENGRFGMEKFGALNCTDKTIAILGDRWPQTAKQEGHTRSKIVFM